MKRAMAEHPSHGSERNEARPLPVGEEGGRLSARMRELILGFNVDERRKRQGDNGVSASGKRRRRSDTNS